MPTQTIAPMFPLTENVEQGLYEVFGIKDTTRVVDQNIKMVLLTNKGEWIGKPFFGVGLTSYLFENPYDVVNGRNYENGKVVLPLRENILTQLEAFIPYITVSDLQINFGGDGRLLNVRIKYFINDSELASEVNLELAELASSLPDNI